MSLSEPQLLNVLVALVVVLVASRGVGELARRAGLPEVLGQLLAGVMLGPSILGVVGPGAETWLFKGHAVGTSLSALSWMGAVLLLLLGGLEVDLTVIKAKARVGALTAAGAITSSIAVGIGFGELALGQSLASAAFLGVVLSVTAVTVTTAFLLEQGLGRRDYAQIILVAGVSSEVLVWLLVPVVPALFISSGSPLTSGVDAAITILGVFLFLMTLGRRLTFWAMRRCADTLRILRAPISLVLILTLAAAALTQALGLHPLLGAFIVGLLLAGAPRVNPPLLQSVRTPTLGFFAPIFFTVAGMQVDVTQLDGLSAIAVVVGLFAAMGAVKFCLRRSVPGSVGSEDSTSRWLAWASTSEAVPT
ncbi:MAG: cation:proton antiporter [Acidimicrobiales bacterium]